MRESTGAILWIFSAGGIDSASIAEDRVPFGGAKIETAWTKDHELYS